MRPSLLAAAPLVVTNFWVVALAASPGDYQSHSVVLMASGLIIMSTVAVVGMVVVGGRWAHRLALVVIASTLPIALTLPLDALWAVALAVTTAGGIALLSPGITSRIRKLPAADGPPHRVVLVSLLLLAAPVLLGVSGASPAFPALAVGLGGPIASFLYTRVIPGGLTVLRLAWPALAIGLSPVLGWPDGLISALLAALVLFLAWHPQVRTAFHPPREVASGSPI